MFFFRKYMYFTDVSFMRNQTEQALHVQCLNKCSKIESLLIFSFRSMFTEILFLPLPSLCSFRGIKAANWNKNRAKCCKTLHLYYNVAWPECWTFVFCFHCPFTLLQNGRFLRKYNWTVRPNEPCANHCNHDIATLSFWGVIFKQLADILCNLKRSPQSRSDLLQMRFHDQSTLQIAFKSDKKE